MIKVVIFSNFAKKRPGKDSNQGPFAEAANAVATELSLTNLADTLFTQNPIWPGQFFRPV